jgi:hypothetical protein
LEQLVYKVPQETPDLQDLLAQLVYKELLDLLAQRVQVELLVYEEPQAKMEFKAHKVTQVLSDQQDH